MTIEQQARDAELTRMHWQFIAASHQSALAENRPEDFKDAKALHAHLSARSAAAVKYADREFPLPVGVSA